MVRWQLILIIIALWALVPLTVFGIAAFHTPWLAEASGGAGEGLMGAFVSGELATRAEPFIYLGGTFIFLWSLLALRNEGLQQQLAYYNVQPALPAADSGGKHPHYLQLTPPDPAESQALVRQEEGPGPRTTSDVMELATQVLDQGWRHAEEVSQALARVDLTTDAFALIYHLMLGRRMTPRDLTEASGFDLQRVESTLAELQSQERVSVGAVLCRLTPEGRRTIRRAAEELAYSLEEETLARIWERARA